MERRRNDYGRVPPHSTHNGLTLEAVRLDHATGRLSYLEGPGVRPLPSEAKISYEGRRLWLWPRDQKGRGSAASSKRLLSSEPPGTNQVNVQSR